MALEDLLKFKADLENFIFKSPALRKLLEETRASEEVVANKHSAHSFVRVRGETFNVNECEVRLNLKPHNLNKQSALCLAILSWYMPHWTRFELHEILEKYFTDNIDLFDLKIYLESKRLMLCALHLETHVTKSSLFGNILTGFYQERIQLTNGEEILQKRPLHISLYFWVPPRSRRKVYKRGYNDHHSSAPFDQRVRRQEAEKEGLQEQLKLEQDRLKARINFLTLKLKLEDFFRPP